MARVLLEGVSKRFGDVVAVDDVSLEVADGEFLVLLGPSGCGKSTVLRLVAGLEELTAGSVRIGDRDVSDVEARDRDIAMVFQSYALYPHLTVRGNVEFPLKRRKVPATERAALVADVARTLGLDDLLERRPGQLSGGQRQRVALARAIVRRPAAFLMDEPLSNLDAKLRVQTRAELVELHRRLATTVVYVTHDQVEAMTMGDRIAVLDRGRLQQVGRAQDVYDAPANTFVAQFIGSPAMNLWAGRLAGDGDALAVEVAGGTLPLAPELAGPLAGHAGREVLAGARPEHVSVGEGGVGAEVVVVESLGHERHLVCRTADGATVVVRAGAHAAQPDPGTLVSLVADPARVHVFDAATGQRIP